ncbi:MAG: T9SS type A sorting domain-containing protein, partial [Dysgonamonadaceae bacterium]|nr:T9SS type A sorting domain-containing protein [Dysgonamonadaceae bacterium]
NDNDNALTHSNWHTLSIPVKEAFMGDFTFGGWPRIYISELKPKDGAVDWYTIEDLNTKFTAGTAFIYYVMPDEFKAGKGLQLTGGKLQLPFFASVSTDPFFKSHPFHEYNAGTGTSTFHYFKKSGNDYVNADGIKPAETVARTNNAYRLSDAYVQEVLSFGTGFDGTGDQMANATFALVGNPFMSSIHFWQLHKDHSTKFKSNFQVLVGSQFAGWSIINPETGAGQPLAIGGLSNGIIAPMQSFVVEKLDNNTALAETFNLNLAKINYADGATTETHVTGQGTLRAAASENNLLAITAGNTAGNYHAFIANRADGSAVFGERDARMVQDVASDIPAVYMLKPDAQGNPVSVLGNFINTNEGIIPLGLTTTFNGEISLTFTGMDRYDAQIALIDTEANPSQIDLTSLTSYVHTFNYTASAAANENRFFISFVPNTPTGSKDVNAEAVNVLCKNGIVSVTSTVANPIQSVVLYNAQGQEVQSCARVSSPVCTLNSLGTQGVYVVKVTTAQGIKTVKVINK